MKFSFLFVFFSKVQFKMEVDSVHSLFYLSRDIICLIINWK